MMIKTFRILRDIANNKIGKTVYSNEDTCELYFDWNIVNYYREFRKIHLYVLLVLIVILRSRDRKKTK